MRTVHFPFRLIYERASLIYPRASAHLSVIACQFRATITSLGKSLEPIPTQSTPLLIHSVRLSLSGDTAPVTITLLQRNGPRIFLTNEGPPTLPAGNTLVTSQPAAWALLISDTEPHPGE